MVDVVSVAAEEGVTSAAVLRKWRRKWKAKLTYNFEGDDAYLPFMDDMAEGLLRALVVRFKEDPETFFELVNEGHRFLARINILGVAAGFPDSDRCSVLPPVNYNALLNEI